MRIAIILLLFLIAAISYFITDLSQYLIPRGNEVTVGTPVVVHSSMKCKVESVEIENSKSLNGHVFIITLFRSKMNFEVTCESYRNFDFYVNSNFFDGQGDPLAELRIYNKTKKSRTAGGGFFVSDGSVGIVTIFSRPLMKYISQSSYVAIKNAVINNSYNKSRWGTMQTYRALIGENQKGDILVLHSAAFGFVTIAQISQLAKNAGIINGIHLDGGTSVAVKLVDGSYRHSFQSVSDLGKKINNIHQPPVHIVGRFSM